MTTATREEILRLTTQREHLLASGLQDSDFKDGSLAMGRVYCCHPSTDEGTAIWFYVPFDAPVQPGDIVVVRMGHEATKWTFPEMIGRTEDPDDDEQPT